MIRKFKNIIQKTINSLGYKLVIEDHALEREFLEIYNKCKPYTMTSKERMYALYKATRYIVQAKIPGDFVECGVWKGGSAMIILHTLVRMGVSDRKVYLYDTYEGMSQPTKEDKTIAGNSYAMSKWKQRDAELLCLANLAEVKANIFSTGYNPKNIFFVRGKVEDTIPKTKPKKISLLRLDTDWYESTKHELTHLFPSLSKKGILIIDDYGHWAGSKKAVDEYFAKKPILLNRIDYTGRIATKG